MLRRLTGIFGGYAYRRRDLRLLYAAVFLSFLGASVTFPLRILYAQAHGASPVQLGVMAGSFLAAPLLVQLPLGWLVDRWGRVPVLLLALIAHPILSFLYIPLNSPNELIALRFLEGISVSAFQPAIGAFIADVTPEEHRAEAYGALGATLNGGLLIGPLVGGVIGQYFGFTVAFLVNVGIEVLAIPLVLGHVHEPELHRATDSTYAITWRRLLQAPLPALYVAFLCMQVVGGTLSALWAIWIHDLGGSYTYLGITYTVFALPQIFAGAPAGRMADRRGRAWIVLAGGAVAGLIYAVYGFIDNLVLIAVLGVIEGVAIVFLTPINQALLAEASPASARGRAQGAAGAMSAVGGAVSAFAAVPLYHDSRPVPFVLAGLVIMVGAVIAAGAAITLRRGGVLGEHLQPQETPTGTMG